MALLERYAYASHLRAVDPLQKLGLSGTVLILCLTSPHPAVGGGAFLWMIGLLISIAGVPLRVVVRLLIAQGLFLGLAVIGVALSVSTSAPPAPFRSVALGPFWISTSPAALDQTLLLLSRAGGSVSALSFLTLTTPMVDLFEGLRRLRVPVLLLDVMQTMYRFIFLLLDTMERMVIAQQSRLGYATWRTSMRSSGIVASRVWLDAYQRSRRMQQALDSRGYAGELRVLPSTYHHSRNLYLLHGVMMLSLLAVWWWQ